MIPRRLLQSLQNTLKPGRVWMLLGPRRVGKTQLIQDYLASLPNEKWYQGHGEDRDLAELLESQSGSRLRQLFRDYDGFFLDEAQSVNGVGASLKLIVDLMPQLKIIVTGSSAFRLDQMLGQPLTGRRSVHYLHPITVNEIVAWKDSLAPIGQLPDLLNYGSYPEVLMIGAPEERQAYLRQLVEDYLFQDILAFEQLRNARKLRDLTTLVAHQIGSELSLNELANSLQINKATVERYLDLLEKSFVIFRIGGFSRNLRKEVSKTMRYYFVDNGIRNAVINQFQPIDQRPDRGALWENFFVNERRRFNAYANTGVRHYFWRTYDQQEIDLIEVSPDNSLQAFECKWQDKKHRIPAAWKKAYPEIPVQFIHPKNFMDHLV
jgi:predicted AAA+ superfamily ATPase